MTPSPGHADPPCVSTAIRSAKWLLACALALAFCLVAPRAAASVTVQVLDDQPNRTVLRYDIAGYDLEPVIIGGQSHVHVKLGSESPLKRAGAPELPTVNRSIVIADDARVEASVLDVAYYEVPDIDVAPSKGILYRSVNPADVPYTFGPRYQQDQFFPGDLVRLRDPYILRDHRGVVVEVFPFQYNPVTRVLRVIQSLTVKVYRVGPGHTNVLRWTPRGPSLAFHQIGRHHFLNYEQRRRYAPLDESGDMLIIAHDAWLSNVQALANHKNAIGIPTTVIGVSDIGNDPSALQAYIQNAYDNGNLSFVLLVGDVAQLATPTASGGASDPSYVKLAGNDDYPDALIGRFSAESAAHVDTQVARTIAYEQNAATQQNWFRKGIGIASDEGPGDDNEWDYEHVDNIRADLMGYGYTEVDQIYDPGAQASTVGAAIDAGRGIINYTGHGSPSDWSTTGFSSADVDALTNVGQLPFIVSVACNNGEFDTGTCFGEAWLRATHNGDPTGAIGIYASSIGQDWDSPMAAQDEIVDLLVAAEYFSLGALCFGGASLMMDEYPGVGVEMYDTWHLFGDPSLRVFGTAAPPTGMLVKPSGGLQAAGDAGGPFTPSEQVYTLENANSSPLSFSVSNGASWGSVDPTSGTLAPGGSTQVTVSVNADANSLTNGYYEDTVEFVNETDHDGDCARQVGLTVGVPHQQYEWPLDDDPGWTLEGAWAFGQPTGGGGTEFGNSDPTSGYTGDYVYGYNLAGDYPNSMPEHHLVSEAIDCSGLVQVSLRFWRWLNVEESTWDHATVSVSIDGSTWSTVWQNSGNLEEAQWQQQEIDLSSVADGEATLYIRWTMGPSDEVYTGSGWNIDDIEIWGVGSCEDGDSDGFLPESCGGADCDDQDADVHPDADEICDDQIDNDCDDDTDDADADCQGTGGAGGGTGGMGGAGGTGGAPGGAGGSDVAPMDAGDDEGCGCSLPGRGGSPHGALALLALLGLAFLRRK